MDESGSTPEYRAAVAALVAHGRFGVRLGLGRMHALLRVLGSPEAAVRGALIGGTNGKGSTQALVGSALRAGGRLVGQTPKPHLATYRERIVVDGSPIAAPDFAALVADVLSASGRVPARLGPTTEFELLTAAALLWFARCRIDVAVVEVGLGGRLDATNAWDGGVAAITSVDFDHMEYLGDTIAAIAREKAAILKRGDRAVSGARGEAAAVIARRARRLGVPLDPVDPLPVKSLGRTATTVVAPGLGELRLGLLGRHQAANAAVALGVLRALDAQGIASVSEAAVRDGFRSATWPGRLELLCVDADGRAHPAVDVAPDTPRPDMLDVLLDGAHNASGAAALADAVEALQPHLADGPAVLLAGILRDKEVATMLAALGSSSALAGARLVATDVPGTGRSLPAGAVAAGWATPGMAVAVPDADEALSVALSLARDRGGPLVVAGSLYLVGHVRTRLLGDTEGAGVGSAR